MERKIIKSRLGVGSAIGALTVCLLASATQAQVPGQSSGISDIVVTGSRIAIDGFDSPTPVTMMSSEDIQSQVTTNLADFVNQMPAIAGSSTPTTSGNSISGGTAGINALNLRHLGPSRTLVLLDGRRSVASSSSGLVDVNTFPQELVQRVEIVTGGASAAYGSDAVGGVVNFILDKDFTGLKTIAEYGITNYGDGTSYRLGATAGMQLMDNRLKILLSAEYSGLPGIHTINRPWNDKYYFMVNNPRYVPGNGEPERFIGYGIGRSLMTPGGLITAGPLKGTYFGTLDPATGKATTGQFAYGEVAGPWMIGGDYKYSMENYVGTSSLQPSEDRYGAFGRVSYEISPSVEIFGEFSYNYSRSKNIYIQPPNEGNVRIMADNAYVPDSVRQQLQDIGASSFMMGTSNYGIPMGGSDTERKVYRAVVGANGDFHLGDTDWNWDLYYQHGWVNARLGTIGVYNLARLALATDAVYAPEGNAAGIPSGTIVCRSTLTDPTNGCVPMNRMGVGGVTQQSVDYILGPEDAHKIEKIWQDVAALTFSGNNLFLLPGGPVATAFGVEWRREKVGGHVDPQYSSGWLYGNYKVDRGSYNVAEGFLEILAPVFDGFEMNLAGRFTNYSTSGSVQTWKVGSTYSPISDIKFRGNISRDIRAPNLQDLFAAGTARSNSVIINDRPYPFVLNQTGNLDVKPEKADSWSVGAVVSPSFIPGLNFSVDYWDINVKDAIGTLQQQVAADMCYKQHIQERCDDFVWGIVNGEEVLQTYNSKPMNFASQHAKGIDIEASYSFDLGQIASSMPGSMRLHASATNYISNIVDTGQGIPTEIAGRNHWYGGNGSVPSWIYRLSATYRADPMTFSLIGRGLSAGTYENKYVECQAPNCPISTVDSPTINNNHIGGALYLDTSVAYDFNTGFGDSTGQLQLSIRNLLNKDPELMAQGPDGQGAAPNPQAGRRYYDLIGRFYRVAVRFNF